MRPRAQALRVATLLAVALCLPCGTSSARTTRRQAHDPRATFEFENADIAAVARAMASVLGREIVVDPRVKGTLSLVTDAAVTPARATLLFSESLRGLGFALVEANGLLKVVPEADAKLESGTVTTAPSAAGGDRVETQVVRIVHANASSLVPALRPLITANNTINVNPGNNTLVITDYASNLVRLDAIIAALDTPSATDVEVMPLQHALASELAATVLKLSDGASQATATAGTKQDAAAPSTSAGAGSTSVIADPQLNALLVRAPDAARLAAIRALVAQLDQPGAGGTGTRNVHVIYLEHADAARLATVLRAALPSPDASKGGGSGTGGGGSGAGSAPAPATTGTSINIGSGSSSDSSSSSSSTTPVTATAAPSTGGYIQADPASNALIVTAPEPVFRDIRAIVEQLDVRRAQLYVESLVVEVDASKALDVGLQWKSLFGISESELSEVTLGEVATALATTTGTNILSTANLVTLDNEEAKIVVGQNVPFVTGSYTTSASTSTTNPFQTIERKDVGLTLRIRPQIGRNGAIRMTILQESSSVASISTTEGPTTNKRSIESTVTVRDGKILVLGGLIEDSDVKESDNLPLISALPWIGNLFRSLSTTRKKTNLLVFLRPVVMHGDADEGDGDALSIDRYDEIRARQAALPEDVQKALEHSAPPALPDVRR